MECVADKHRFCKDHVKYSYMQAGHDYIGVGVGALIFNDQGQVFMGKRGPKARNEVGKWEIPGGAVEFGETFEEAVKREVLEEYGVTVRVRELLQICDHLIFDEKEHWVSPTYICEIVEGEPCINEPEKCTEIGWYSPQEALKLPLSIVTRHDIDTLIERGY